MGVGVVLYVRDKYQATKLLGMCIIEECIETVFIRVSLGTNKYVLGCIYRPPKSDIASFLHRLDSLLIDIRDNYPQDKLLLHGDFNLNFLLYESNKLCNEFLSFLNSANCMPTISIPSRVGSSSATLIDNIFAHNDVLLKSAGVVLCNVSDHYAVLNVFDVEMECKLDESYVDIEKKNNE